MKHFHENHIILLDGQPTYLLSHWDSDLGLAICVSGPKVLLLHESNATELDGAKLDLKNVNYHAASSGASSFNGANLYIWPLRSRLKS